MKERVKATIIKPEPKRENKASQTQKTGPSQSISSPVEQILFLQRTIGNQAVGRLLKSGALQAKLKIWLPGDIYEQEADRMAEQVMRMPETQVSNNTKVSNPARNNPIQRKCPGCKKGTKIEKEEKLQKKEASGSTHEVTHGIENSISALPGGGQPLPESMRAFYEPRFGADFSGVRVHTGSQAAETAKSINARAFTMGNNIAFGGGQFAPKSQEGQELLAHELTHTIQQGASKISPSAFPIARVQPKQEHGAIGNMATDASQIAEKHKQPLPDSLRGEVEPRFGLDFGDVRLYTGQLNSGLIQRDSTGADRARFREETIKVRWIEDDRDFYHRIINAIATSPAFKGIGKSALWQPFYGPAFHVFREYGLRLSPKPGDQVQLRAKAFFDPDIFHGSVTSASLMSEQTARLGETKITGVVKPNDIFADRGPNELGPHGIAELSFSSDPSVSATALGGLKWSIKSGGGSLSGGNNGKATFTAGNSTGWVRLDLSTVSGFSAGTVVASLTIKVLNVQDMVSRAPEQPERLTVNREGLTPELLAEQFYGDKTKATAIWAVWDEKARGEAWKTTTRIPKGMWVGVEYRHLTGKWQTVYDASVDIKSRASWGAKPPITGDPKRSYELYTVPLEDILDSIVVHHAGNKGYKTMNEVQDLHQGEKERADIGYHFGISLKGQMFEGRPIGVKGAHVDAANTGKIGIVLLADLDPENKGLKWYESDKDEDPLSSEMEQSLLKLIHFLIGKYPNIKYLGGHDDYDPRRFCPGKKAMDKMATWRSNTNLQHPP